MIRICSFVDREYTTTRTRVIDIVWTTTKNVTIAIIQMIIEVVNVENLIFR